MSLNDGIALALLLAGCAFYLAGTIGLLRFPDVYCRLHALAKADNTGLLLICAGLAVLGQNWQTTTILALVWLVGLLASTVSAHLIARHAHRGGQKPSETKSRHP
ncbi:MAG: monovalent cation/H(+) antiporter subunit G [Wenzhouxiangella sp.]|jgi:multicomponent Na+:H+ antiporter subunit G|nr:monovalent cation/H(+) antiporter subunit G [Wenzhouxiangella sp.]